MSTLTSDDLARAEVRGSYEITVGDRVRLVTVARLGPASCGEGLRYGLRIDDGPVLQVDASRPVADVLSLLIEDDVWEAGLVRTDEGFDVKVRCACGPSARWSTLAARRCGWPRPEGPPPSGPPCPVGWCVCSYSLATRCTRASPWSWSRP